jgi:hypothetical protein
LDYNGEHRNKPQTVALALGDTTMGVAPWIVEKLKAWSDPPKLGPVFTNSKSLRT